MHPHVAQHTLDRMIAQIILYTEVLTFAAPAK